MTETMVVVLFGVGSFALAGAVAFYGHMKRLAARVKDLERKVSNILVVVHTVDSVPPPDRLP